MVMKLSFFLIVPLLLPASVAQFPNDFAACGVASGEFATCFLANLAVCSSNEDACQLLTPGLDDDSPSCDSVDEQFCNGIELCCEACRDTLIDYANACGTCDETIACSFGPSVPATEDPELTPCERAVQDYISCPFQPENIDQCTGATGCTPFADANTAGILQPPLNCDNFKEALCVDAVGDGCCEPCNGLYETYINTCFFDEFFDVGTCACDVDVPASPTASTPEAPSVTPPADLSPAPPTEDATIEPPTPAMPGSPTMDPPTGDSIVDPLSQTITPTQELDLCEAESAALDSCAEAQCLQCDEQLEDTVSTGVGFPTCDSIQLACGMVEDCCPECFQEYNAVMECLFRELLSSTCSCEGGGGGGGATSSSNALGLGFFFFFAVIFVGMSASCC